MPFLDLISWKLSENDENRRKRKWKELKSFWNRTFPSHHLQDSIEKIMWMSGDQQITADRFVVMMMREFQYRDQLKAERFCNDIKSNRVLARQTHNSTLDPNSLRVLYLSFDGGVHDHVDWRDIQASFQILYKYTWVKQRPVDLLVQLFELYARTSGPSIAISSTAKKRTHNGSLSIHDTRTILHLPCVSDAEIRRIDALLQDAVYALHSAPLSSYPYRSPSFVSPKELIYPQRERDNADYSSSANMIAYEGRGTSLERNRDAATAANHKLFSLISTPAIDEVVSNSHQLVPMSSDSKLEASLIPKRSVAFKECTDPFPESVSIVVNYTTECGRNQISNHEKESVAVDLELDAFAFRELLVRNTGIVTYWQDLCWNRLPTELRLKALDEAQEDALQAVEAASYLQNIYLADEFLKKRLCIFCFGSWVIFTATGQRFNFFLRNKFLKVAKDYLKFWRRITASILQKRRRKLLAEVMYAYTLKSRSFKKILLFNYTIQKIAISCLVTLPHMKLMQQGLGHVRTFVKLWGLRRYYHKWWNNIVNMINLDAALNQYVAFRFSTCFFCWLEYSCEEKKRKKRERIEMEHRVAFERLLADSEQAAMEIALIEKARADQAQKVVDEEKAAKVARTKELAQSRAEAVRAEENRQILVQQTVERRQAAQRRLREKRLAIKRKWNEVKKNECEKIPRAVSEYFENPTNKEAIAMTMVRYKEEFHQAPSPETRAREKHLTSLKNISFLFMTAKLEKVQITVKKSLRKFDVQKKGYLTFDEFKLMISTSGFSSSPTMFDQICKETDLKMDGRIDLEELKAGFDALSEHGGMGVPRSPWRMYVDPIEDVIVYHNFKSGQKVLEYQIKDSIFLDIMLADMLAMKESAVIEEATAAELVEWTEFIGDFSVRMIQKMYRRWKARKRVRMLLWKVDRNTLKANMSKKSRVIKFVELRWMGWKTREAFARQLHLAYAKCWDANSQRIFWFNHETKVSVWEKPFLLIRYGDVPSPSPWIAVDIPIYNNEASAPSSLITQSSYSVALVPAVVVEENQSSLLAVRDTTAMGSDDAVTASKHIEDTVLEGENYLELLKSSKKKKAAAASASALGPAAARWDVHYFHVKAQRQLPRKPDGFALCGHCRRNISVYNCQNCISTYCYGCLYSTHSSPTGFSQSRWISAAQKDNTEFFDRLKKFSSHVWCVEEPKRCSICCSSKIYAGVRCSECSAEMCRPCSRRVHSCSPQNTHRLELI